MIQSHPVQRKTEADPDQIQSIHIGVDKPPNVEIKMREGWVLLKIPRGDIDGVGEVK